MRTTLTVLLLSVLPAFPALAAGISIIGHPGMQPLDPTTLQRIYTGKVVEVNGLRVTPVNLNPDSELRTRFLRDYLGQNEDKYSGYWTVRRYVGKGTPPQELNNAAEVIQFVTKNAGAIGYVDETDLTPDINILLRQSP